MIRMLSTAPVVIALGLPVLAPTARAEDTPTLPERLERMVERLEQRRTDHHIPGMAIAVVKDGTVILSRGFGLADVETGEPATDQTLFAAGSTTKAFTAALIGMLVDDGRMSWDDPVRNHLPGFRLSDPEANEKVVMRDLLCHRTGLASMNVLWYGADTTSADVLAAAAKAEMLYGFREQWNYSNISFLAAGVAAGNASDAGSWDALIARRIFEPLGMTSSTTFLEAAQSDPRLATGYRWVADASTLESQAMRRVEAVAPAGAINSNVRDMARWVRFQLGRGEFDGRRLLSSEQHEETWTRHSTIGGGVDYGLGWMLRDWNGQPVIEHAGGIDGFTAEVALLPEENLGYVLLMNLIAAPLQDESREIVFGALLDDPTDDDGTGGEGAADDTTQLVGTYIGNFAMFKDAKFEVLVQNGNLAIDVPGQMVYELHPPDDEGMRFFRLTNTIAVRFNTGDDGQPVSLSMFQNGLEFEMPREGVEVAVQPLDEADRELLGTYHFEQLGADVTVRVVNGRIAVDVPGQMAFELHPPDDEGRRAFRVRDTIWVRFDRGADGSIATVHMNQDGTTFDLPRSGDAPEGEIPTGAELMARVHRALGAENVARLGSVRAKGRVRLPHQGIEGQATMELRRSGVSRRTIDLGRFGRTVSQVGRDGGWVEGPAYGHLELTGELLFQTQLQNPLVWADDWGRWFESYRVMRRDRFEDADVYVVRLVPRDGEAMTMFVDADTDLPAGFVYSGVNHVSPARFEVTTVISEYGEVRGVRLPRTIEARTAISGSVLMEYDTLQPETASAE
ncbi:MAG: serine hydrolase [Planctomycetes bacterium]|nr:serine hydrolase [Planctomycetota bacterium]